MEAPSDGAWRSVPCACLALHFIAPNLPALMSRMASREIVMPPVLPMPPPRSGVSPVVLPMPPSLTEDPGPHGTRRSVLVPGASGHQHIKAATGQGQNCTQLDRPEMDKAHLDGVARRSMHGCLVCAWRFLMRLVCAWHGMCVGGRPSLHGVCVILNLLPPMSSKYDMCTDVAVICFRQDRPAQDVIFSLLRLP